MPSLLTQFKLDEAESVFEVAAQPLSDVLSPEENTRARVFKVDKEGTEGFVVRGMVPLLDQFRPDAELAIEVTPQRMLELRESAMEHLGALQANGFHMYRLRNDCTASRYSASLATRIRDADPVAGADYRGGRNALLPHRH
ncbi:hypothetical protein [Streptomyces sp. NPDC045470]|uniref:hypothetical protein n=1 Tax=Streptomyces sp. NPDC045470 TaxID=3155469 RepID=UPI0033CC0A52